MALCQCGCEKETEPYKITDERIGAIKGQPARFIKGHKQRYRPTSDGILEYIKRVLAMTESHHWPVGDIRQSTYLEGLGRFSRSAFYKAFESWEEALQCIFPEGIEVRRSNKMYHVELEENLDRKMRSCLAPGCGVMFLSPGPQNRRCDKCKTMQSYIDGDEDETYELAIPGMRGTLA